MRIYIRWCLEHGYGVLQFEATKLLYYLEQRPNNVLPLSTTHTHTHTSMSSPSNTTTAALPRYSTTAPPPYTASDAYSVTSGKFTSKSILAKVFNRKCKTTQNVTVLERRHANTEAASGATSSGSKMTQKEVDANEAKHAARATYFSMM
jgi:hypothetical protein